MKIKGFKIVNGGKSNRIDHRRLKRIRKYIERSDKKTNMALQFNYFNMYRYTSVKMLYVKVLYNNIKHIKNFRKSKQNVKKI